jgi:PPK2 family polyphosphate:nucleotide phosphotransferase
MQFTHKAKGQTDLNKIDPSQDGGLTKEQAKAMTAELGTELDALQELLYAAGSHGLLIVLQGRDTAGKDGTIRGLSSYLNILSAHATGFKVPTPEEISHDFLWRVHSHAPGKGQVGIFNRSHYEDVLVVRVHKFAPKEVWSKRYDQINEFEQLLAESNTIILKFCLHISKKEQEERLLAREEDPTKAWKLNVNDWKEREFWDDYTEAYNDAINKCNGEHAPWHIVPADRKWFRDLAITQAIVEALKPYKKQWMEMLTERGQKAQAELMEYRQAQPGQR